MNVDELLARQTPPSVDVEIGGTTYHANPLGVDAVLRFQEGRASANPVRRYFAMRRFLRAAFGWHWRRDPVSALMNRSPETRGKVVAALLQQAGANSMESK
jgi:hypothetical protein